MRTSEAKELYKTIEDAQALLKGNVLPRSYGSKEELYRKAYRAAQITSCIGDGDWLQNIDGPIHPCDKCMILGDLEESHDDRGHKEWECNRCHVMKQFVDFPSEENHNEHICVGCSDKCVWLCYDCEIEIGLHACEFGCCTMCDHYIAENGKDCPQLKRMSWESSKISADNKAHYRTLKQKFTSYEGMYKVAFENWLDVAKDQIWEYRGIMVSDEAESS